MRITDIPHHGTFRWRDLAFRRIGSTRTAHYLGTLAEDPDAGEISDDPLIGAVVRFLSFDCTLSPVSLTNIQNNRDRHPSST